MASKGLRSDNPAWQDVAPPLQMDDDEIHEEFDYSHVVHILTSQVRNHYLTYVKNLLNTNFKYCAAQTNVSDAFIRQCAIMLEERAARSCMVVNLYRKSILQIIQTIRDDTSRKQLNECIQVELQKGKTGRMMDASSQTVPADIGLNHVEQRAAHSVRPKTLDEKLRYFELKMNTDRKIAQKKQLLPEKLKTAKPRHFIPPPSFASTPESLPPPATPPALLTTPSQTTKGSENDIDDDITNELHEIFGTQHSRVDPVEEIFGESFSDNNEHCTPDVVHDQNNASSPVCHLPSTPLVIQTYDYTEELTNSIWPCEYHRQRLKLQRVLENISEKGWRHSEKVKRRFLLLFGEDDDDEFGPYSPSLAMNDVLMASCKKRIAPWIVKALMAPMRNGQIANRVLFKKIAKRIAESVLVETQHPEEAAILEAVAYFFSIHPQVNRVEDL